MKGVVRIPDLKAGDTAIIRSGESLIGVLRVTPVDLAMKSSREKHALHGFYQELLDKVTYPLQIYSRQRLTDLERYGDRVAEKDGFSFLRSDYVDFCRDLGEGGIIDTDHFILVHASGRHDDPGSVLEKRLREVISVVSGGDLGIYQVRGEDLHRFAETELDSIPTPTREFCSTPTNGSGEYRKMAFVEEYPSKIRFGWPVQLLKTDGLVDIVQHIRPVGIDDAVRKLRRQSEKLEAEISAFLAYGHRGINELERSLDDTEWFLDLLADQECRPVQYGAYITAHGPTRKRTRETFGNVVSDLRSLGIEYMEPAFRNDYAYYTDSPFFKDWLEETMLTPSKSAATGFPFGTRPVEHRNGVVYGVATEEGTPVLLDRFSWDSHSIAVIGTVGSGKSYSAKLDLLRSKLVYPRLKIIVVDPKKEYRSVVEALGGEMRFINRGNDYCFNRNVLGFEVEERGEPENTPALAELVGQIYSSTSKDRDPTIVLIDEARILLKDRAGRDILNQFVLEARDINTGIHLVTQSAPHFTETQDGRDILSNLSGTVFFRQEEVAVSLIDHFDFSEQEEWSLSRLRSGNKASYSEALLRIPDVVNTKIRIESTPAERRLIESKNEQVSEPV